MLHTTEWPHGPFGEEGEFPWGGHAHASNSHKALILGADVCTGKSVILGKYAEYGPAKRVMVVKSACIVECHTEFFTL